MSEVWEEIGAGREPENDLPPHGPSRRPSGEDAMAWARRHPLVTVALVLVAVVAVGGVRWGWQRTHVPSADQAISVQLDPSEYLIAGRIDGKGQADVLLLLHVDVAPGFREPVELVRMEGGGITVASAHPIDTGGSQFAVPARVSCDQWADGKGVRAVFQVGPGTGREVGVPLDTGHNSPVHAQITTPCRAFALTHPLRLSVFSVTFQARLPILETTWTMVNRSDQPLNLDPADDLTVDSNSPVPLSVIPGGVADGPTTIAPHESVSVVRRLEVTSCRNTADLDPNGTSLQLVAAGQPSADGGNGKAVVDLPGEFVQQLMNVAIDVCLGAPDLGLVSASVTLTQGPPGKGSAVLRVGGFALQDGPWRIGLADDHLLRSPQDAASGTLTQQGVGKTLVGLEERWVIRHCTVRDLPDHGDLTVTVELTSIRTYPFELPVSVVGQTDCTPGDVQG